MPNIKHGMSESEEFGIWTDMQTRCYNPKSIGYKNYGGRGITVCARWLASFADFLSDVGPRPSPKYTIDRMDNNGNYEPGNVRWATRLEQANNRRTNIRITIGSETRTLREWCRERNTKPGAAWLRYKEGIRGEALFETTCFRLTHDGITAPVSEWSKRTGIKATTIAQRVKVYGWTVADALTKGV